MQRSQSGVLPNPLLCPTAPLPGWSTYVNTAAFCPKPPHIINNVNIWLCWLPAVLAKNGRSTHGKNIKPIFSAYNVKVVVVTGFWRFSSVPPHTFVSVCGSCRWAFPPTNHRPAPTAHRPFPTGKPNADIRKATRTNIHVYCTYGEQHLMARPNTSANGPASGSQ